MRRARTGWRLAAVLGLALLAAGALVGALGSSSAPLLTLLPALALAVAMLVRPYLGERAIARLRRRRDAHRCVTRPTRSIVVRRRSRRPLARGGLLIASALAGRAPPAALAGCR